MQGTNPENAGAQPSGPTAGTIDTAASAAHGAIDRIGAPQSMQGTADRFKQAAHGAIDRAAEAARPAARWIESKQPYAEEQLEATAEYVSANPLKAIAVAFLAGFVIGRLTS